MIEVTDNLNFIDLLTVTLNLKPFPSAAPHMQKHIFIVCITELQALKTHQGYGLTEKGVDSDVLEPFFFPHLEKK